MDAKQMTDAEAGHVVGRFHILMDGTLSPERRAYNTVDQLCREMHRSACLALDAEIMKSLEPGA